MTAKYKCSMCNESAVKRGLCEKHLRASWYSPTRKQKKRVKRVTKTRVIDPFYKSEAWKSLSKTQLEQHPICARCNSMGIIKASEHADHIKPVRKFPDLKLEPSNLQSLCLPCHNVKTGKERTGIYYDYARGVAYEDYE